MVLCSPVIQLGITNSVAYAVPQPYITFGLAGGLPYVSTAVATAYLAHQAGSATTSEPRSRLPACPVLIVGIGTITNIDPGVAITVLDQALHIQMTYGAVLLSFLGALHWGFEFAKYGGYQGYSRLVLGVAPLLAAWPTLSMEPQLALVAQWFIFTSLVSPNYPIRHMHSSTDG